MLGLSFCLGQLHLAANVAGKATKCQDIMLPGKTDSYFPLGLFG